MIDLDETQAKVIKELAMPFPSSAIHWRIGSRTKDRSRGVLLAYLDARDVMDRLDTVVGPANWQTKVIETARGRTLCELSIRINGEWITKTDGAGDTDVEGEKGSISDALKRAAVNFGVGRYLYRLEAKWVPLTNEGRSFDKKQIPALPDWALPENERRTDRGPTASEASRFKARYYDLVEELGDFVSDKDLDHLLHDKNIDDFVESSTLNDLRDVIFKLEDAKKAAANV